MGILESAKPAIIICTRDRARVTAFYHDTLGLTVAYEDSFAAVFNIGGVTLRVSIVADFTPHEHTILGFTVTDVAATVKALREKGVIFNTYRHVRQDELGVWSIDTGDKMQASAGSFALVGMPALRDSTVAANLRAGGAVILGKTNLSEWANFRSFESISGWSGRGGQTHNRYGIDRNPCGSSSGSAAASSAPATPMALPRSSPPSGSPSAPASCPFRTRRTRSVLTDGQWPMRQPR